MYYQTKKKQKNEIVTDSIQHVRIIMNRFHFLLSKVRIIALSDKRKGKRKLQLSNTKEKS